MTTCTPIATPLWTNEKILNYVGDPLGPKDTTRYHSFVGALQYLTLTTPDPAFLVNKMCQHLDLPTTQHWTPVTRILWYLSYTLSFGLRIKRSESTLVSAYSNADWIGCRCTNDRKSSGGFAIFLGINLISWTAWKQIIVSWSSSEA